VLTGDFSQDEAREQLPLTAGHHVRTAAAFFFARKNFSIVLDTQALGEQDRVELLPFEVRLPLRSPNAVFVEAKLRIER
jgi:hypothetical protein